MRVRIDQAEIDAIRHALETSPSVNRVYRVELIDAAGTVHAEVEKVVYVRKR
jgi:hypothetical protein